MIPAFVNDSAGSATEAREALERVGGIEVHETPPAGLTSALRDELATKPRRIIVAGGDGTICTAASLVVGTDTELAILPGGTLNHFARDHHIPLDLEAAAEVAAHGAAERADIAYAGDRIFLNTSSVGVYVTYVRVRDRLERYFGYRLASVVAALVLLFDRVRPITVEISAHGESRVYSTPIVFIGVGERELKAPALGSRVAGGERCLHVIVVRERRGARLLALAIDALTRGLKSVARTPELDSFLVDHCTLTLHGRGRHVSFDGEIVQAESPLAYRIERDAISVVVPHHSDDGSVAQD